MIIYNPHNEQLLKERLPEAEELLAHVPAKYCFITGSFLTKKKYQDIDVFVISRSKKEITLPNKKDKNEEKNKKIKITIIDFNDLYSLFYHSVAKSCLAKNLLPQRALKVTLSDYWQVVNEAVPTILNQKGQFHKNIRFLVLYTEYFKTGEILDTFQLDEKINSFQKYDGVLEYIRQELPVIIHEQAQPSYIKRFFYTQAGYYRKLLEYEAQSFLYKLAHEIARGMAHG